MQLKSTESSSYLDNEIISMKLQKHQKTAVALLVSGDLSKLDLIIGDASCQVHALVILVIYYRLRKEIGDKKWKCTALLGKEYLDAHAKDKPDTQAKSVKDVKGAIHSKEFDDLVDFVHKHLGEEKFELLGLTYSLWVAGIISTDEFLIDFKYRDNNMWGNHDKALKARLSKLSCNMFLDLSIELPSHQKWDEVLLKSTSFIKNDKGEDIEVLSIQASFSAALAILYQYEISIVDGNIRVQLNRGKQSQQVDTLEHSDSPHALSDITYTFGTARTLLYLPHKKSGTFKYVKNQTEELMNVPAYFMKSWSTFWCESNDKDLYSANHGQYYEALVKIDKRWAVDTYTALHAPFTRRAVHANLDISAVYGQIFPLRARNFQYDRYQLDGLSYLDSENEGPNLAEILEVAMKVAHQRGWVENVSLCAWVLPQMNALGALQNKLIGKLFMSMLQRTTG